MTPFRLCAVFATLTLISACEGGGLLADKPRSPTLEPVPSAEKPAAARTKPDVPLINTYWKLVELNGAAVQAGEGKELHMVLKGQNQLSGYAGCNQFMGSFTTSGNAVSVGPVAATRRMCEGVMDQENAFLLALENASRYRISGDHMSVTDAQGAVTMRFVAVYM